MTAVRRNGQQTNPGYISVKEALVRIQRYCAYQERSHQEVRAKLFSFGLSVSETDELLSTLITDGFLNEQRFAKAFTGGKFRVKKWGRNKIIHILESKGLTDNCIREGLREIEDPEYRKTLLGIIQKKSGQSSETNLFKKRDKIARYAIAKGYEAYLVWDLVKAEIAG